MLLYKRDGDRLNLGIPRSFLSLSSIEPFSGAPGGLFAIPTAAFMFYRQHLGMRSFCEVGFPDQRPVRRIQTVRRASTASETSEPVGFDVE